MGRTSKKYTHNAKTLRRYKVKELRNFIKENKLPIKRTSKLTKGEIISNLIKLQRNGHCECMTKLAVRDKKKLSPLQEKALLKGQNAMKERRRLMKQEVKPSQKIDKKPIKVPVKKEIIEEIRDEIRLEDKPTQIELIKFEGGNEETRLYQEILNLEDLIERAEKDIQKDIEYFEKIMMEEEEELRKELEKEEEPIKEEEKVEPTPELLDDLMDELNKEEEIPIEEPSKDEEGFLKEEISTLTGKELKQILKDNKIKGYSKLDKEGLINMVYNNRNEIDNLQELIDAKRESKL